MEVICGLNTEKRGHDIKDARGKTSIRSLIIMVLRGVIEKTIARANIGTGITIVKSRGIIRNASGKSPPIIGGETNV